MQKLQVLKSTLDESVNFVSKADSGRGYYESRYVRRGDYFIAYLSSQSACNQGCGFCHLTATGQTVGESASRKTILDQARMVMGHYAFLRQERNEPLAPYMHFNFMARGEPLANPDVSDEIVGALGELAARSRIPSKVNISTIMPRMLKQPLAERFLYTKPTIYYSLYSLSESFRAKWLPGAMPYREALARLADYSQRTGGMVKIHYAFIAGENDNPEDTYDLVQILKGYDIPGLSFNVVRYNPADDASRESAEDVIAANVAVLREEFPVQVVKRVGFDVYASCGTFFPG